MKQRAEYLLNRASIDPPAAMLAACLASSCLCTGFSATRLPSRASPVRDASSHAAPVMLPTPFTVPKAYRVPIPDAKEWIKGHQPLYRQRLLYLGQEIEDMVMNQVIASMLFLDSQSEEPMHLYINSPGGSVIAGLALYDTMQHINSQVSTINIGMAASMASFILGAGARGKRLALPNSQVMIHQPMGGPEGQAEDVRVEAEQIYKIKDSLVTMYADMTGQTRGRMVQDLSFDNYMSAQRALEYGLIDKIVTPSL